MRIGVVGLITIGGASSGTAGGVEKLIEEVSTRHAAMGHEVTVYCRAKYTQGRTEFNGVRLVSLPAIYTKHLEAITHSFLSTIAAIRHSDIIQFHSMGPALLSWIPRLFGKKTVCTLHGLDWRRGKWGTAAKMVLRIGEQCAIRFANHTTVVSRFLEKYYPERYGKEVTYIPNGVPPIPQRPIDALKRFGIDTNEYILYLSRIVPEKGLHYLVEAYRKIDTQKKLVIVGDSRHAAEYRAQIDALAEGDDRIVFTGPLYGEEKEEAYSGAYIFCLPSDLEGLPIVLLEAMGNGRCCLTSDIPELVEVIDPPRLGYPDVDPEGNPAPHGATFAQGDVENLRGEMESLLNDPGRAAALGANAKRHADREYNWDRIAEAYIRVYEGVLR